MNCFKGIGILSLAVIFCFTHLSLAQNRFQKTISVTYESGPMLSNGTDWGDKIKHSTDYKALDFRIGWKKVTNTTYNYLYRYPVFGLGFNSALPYSQEIGKPQAIYAYFELPFSRNALNHRLRFFYFGSLGLGFNLKPFDENLNPINQYVGSKVNAYVNLGTTASLQISPRVDLMGSIGLRHYSNGATKKPNAGINLVPFSLGMQVRLGDLRPIPSEKPEIPEKKTKDYWNLALYTGMKNYEIGDPAYFRGGFGLNYLLEPNYKYRLGLGLDLFWAQGMNLRFPEESFSFKDQTSLALVGSWEWQLTERLYVPIGLGVYLYRNEINQEFTWYYERIGARYRFDNNMFAGMQIKAHKAKADFFEFTVGYTIPGKK
jgi:hypothetical protein